MKVYRTKTSKLAGSDFYEVRKKAFAIYSNIKMKSKRRPYIRSAYFKKDKVFLALFWQHLFDQQKWKDRMERLKFFEASMELIRNSKIDPRSKDNPNKANEVLHRFAGITKENDIFYVQIKENKRTNQKYLISIFPNK